MSLMLGTCWMALNFRNWVWGRAFDCSPQLMYCRHVGTRSASTILDLVTAKPQKAGTVEVRFHRSQLSWIIQILPLPYYYIAIPTLSCSNIYLHILITIFTSTKTQILSPIATRHCTIVTQHRFYSPTKHCPSPNLRCP